MSFISDSAMGMGRSDSGASIQQLLMEREFIPIAAPPRRGHTMKLLIAIPLSLSGSWTHAVLEGGARMSGGGDARVPPITVLGLLLPLNSFECATLEHLNVAPSQLHPNSWVVGRAFKDRFFKVLATDVVAHRLPLMVPLPVLLAVRPYQVGPAGGIVSPFVVKPPIGERGQPATRVDPNDDEVVEVTPNMSSFVLAKRKRDECTELSGSAFSSVGYACYFYYSCSSNFSLCSYSRGFYFPFYCGYCSDPFGLSYYDSAFHHFTPLLSASVTVVSASTISPSSSSALSIFTLIVLA
ncbi:hypothetical protein HKD37_12G033982 [Glycine soja]